jgi:hypothetical protein
MMVTFPQMRLTITWVLDGPTFEGSFITANLGSAKTVSSVDIVWYNGASRTNNFVISTSTDATTFTDRFSGTSARSSSFQNYNFADINAQYVRVTVNGDSQND